jgi:hypothetical protein
MSEPIIPDAPEKTGVFSPKSPVFVVASVEKADSPEGEQGQSWYRYVLKSSCSTITGHRCGSRQYVREYATQCAEQLNARAATSQSIWAPRGRKPAAATGI